MSSETANAIIAFATIAVAALTGMLALVTYWLYSAARDQLQKLSEQIKTSQSQLLAAQQAETAATIRHQESLSRERERLLETETLRNCFLFDVDPVIAAACRRIWDASNGGTIYCRDRVSQHDVIVMCNFLDGLAIGVAEGNFDENIVRSHHKQMIEKAVDTIMPAMLDDSIGYEALLALRARFAAQG